jgi:outer membrane protein OmpA-like peptidoglycan-associated protein
MVELGTADGVPRDERSTSANVAWLVLEAVSVAAVAFAVTLVVTAVFKRTLPPVVFGPVGLFENKQPPPQPPVEPALPDPTFSVFFANAASSVGGHNTRYLTILGQGLRDCADLHVRISGSASSVRYYDDADDAKNTALANGRARNVAAFLHNVSPDLALDVVTLSAVPRRYDDIRKSKAAQRATERLNRRVDIYVGNSECRPPK